MAYPKLPEWPIIDPDSPPEGYVKVAHHEDKDRNSIPWDFFVFEGPAGFAACVSLIIHSLFCWPFG